MPVVASFMWSKVNTIVSKRIAAAWSSTAVPYTRVSLTFTTYSRISPPMYGCIWLQFCEINLLEAFHEAFHLHIKCMQEHEIKVSIPINRFNYAVHF